MGDEVICPICKAKAVPLDKLDDADGFECGNHDRFHIADSVIASPALRQASRKEWECALNLARARQLDAWGPPTITTEDFEMSGLPPAA